MFKTLGVQLFTIRSAMTDEDSIRSSFLKLKELGYDEGQTAGFFVGAPKFAEIAKETGLKICGTHCGFGELIADPDRAMEEHDLLGTKNIGIGGMPGDARESLDALQEAVYETLGAHELDPAVPLLANARQKSCCQNALDYTCEALDALAAGMTFDAINVMTDSAADELLALTGKKASEEVVNNIFSKFCVGK